DPAVGGLVRGRPDVLATAGARLADAEAVVGALPDFGQVLLLLLSRAEHVHRTPGAVGAVDDHADRPMHRRACLKDWEVLGQGEPLTAVLLGEGQLEEPGRMQALPPLITNRALALSLRTELGQLRDSELS